MHAGGSCGSHELRCSFNTTCSFSAIKQILGLLWLRSTPFDHYLRFCSMKYKADTARLHSRIVAEVPRMPMPPLHSSLKLRKSTQTENFPHDSSPNIFTKHRTIRNPAASTTLYALLTVWNIRRAEKLEPPDIKLGVNPQFCNQTLSFWVLLKGSWSNWWIDHYM